MRARVGDLAIVRFDPDEEDIKAGRRWCNKVGLVTGTVMQSRNGPRYQTFIWWEKGTSKNDIIEDELPPRRLVRARPRLDDWEGALGSLTLDNVEPVVPLVKSAH